MRVSVAQALLPAQSFYGARGRAHSEEHRIAAAIDQRVRQLEAKGVSDEALPEHMVGYLLDLQRLWSTTSDELLASLCR